VADETTEGITSDRVYFRSFLDPIGEWSVELVIVIELPDSCLKLVFSEMMKFIEAFLVNPRRVKRARKLTDVSIEVSLDSMILIM
jgi:hypothetical protein